MHKPINIKNILSGIIIIALGAVLVGYFILSQNKTYERSMKQRGNEIIYEIEVFKAENGYYPKSLEELFTNNKQVCEIFTLTTLDENKYELSFFLQGKQKMCYHSDSRTWIKHK